MAQSVNATVVILTTVGDPFIDPQGSPVPNSTLEITLVNEDLKAEMQIDSISGELVMPGPVKVTTNSSGAIETPLWPNDRGVSKSAYKFTVSGKKPFYAVVRTIETSRLAQTVYEYAKFGALNYDPTTYGKIDYTLQLSDMYSSGTIADGGSFGQSSTIIVDAGTFDDPSENIKDGGTW